MKHKHLLRTLAVTTAVVLAVFIFRGVTVAQENSASQFKSQSQAGPAGSQGFRGPGFGSRPDLKALLNLTPDQEKQLREFRKARRKANEAFMDQMIKYRREMRDLREDGEEANLTRIYGVIDAISKLRADKQKDDIKAHMDVKKIFTPEQLEKLKQHPGLLIMEERGFMGPGFRGFQGFRGRRFFRGERLISERNQTPAPPQMDGGQGGPEDGPEDGPDGGPDGMEPDGNM